MYDIKVYQPGSYLHIEHIQGQTDTEWVILCTTVELTESDKPLGRPQVLQMLTILATDEDGDDLGKEPITINSDLYDIKEI